MTKYGRPASVVPASRTRAMLTWSIIASACRSASKRAMTWRRVHARLDDLERDLALDRLASARPCRRRPCPLRRSAAAACTGRSACRDARRAAGSMVASASPRHADGGASRNWRVFVSGPQQRQDTIVEGPIRTADLVQVGSARIRRPDPAATWKMTSSSSACCGMAIDLPERQGHCGRSPSLEQCEIQTRNTEHSREISENRSDILNRA